MQLYHGVFGRDQIRAIDLDLIVILRLGDNGQNQSRNAERENQETRNIHAYAAAILTLPPDFLMMHWRSLAVQAPTASSDSLSKAASESVGLTSLEDSLRAFEKKVRDSFGRQAFMSTLGAEIVSVGRGSVEIRFTFSPKLTQQNGFVHAGAVTSIMDSACGYAALSVAPEEADVLTVEFKVNLLAPGTGQSFLARASVKRSGKRLAVCTADAFAVQAGEEKLIATMLATVMNMDSKPTMGSSGD